MNMPRSLRPTVPDLSVAILLSSLGALGIACSSDPLVEEPGSTSQGTSMSTSGSNTASMTTGSATTTSSTGTGGAATTTGGTTTTTTSGTTGMGGAATTTTGTGTSGTGGASSTGGAGGTTGTSGETTGAGGTGSNADPNPSGLPEPGDGGMAPPSGAAGNLSVLPWAGYTGAISYSFDDANDTQINNEDQLLGLGVPFTWYLQTGKQQAGNAFYQRALDAGHELANHTQNHGSGAADQDVNQAQQFIMSQYSVVAYTMAAPNGSTNNYNNIAQQLFILDRGVSDALIGPDDNTNMLNLPSYIPPSGAGTAQLNPKADAVQSQGKWQTVCIHGFSGGSDGAYQPISLDGFVDHVNYVKDKGDVWIGTMLEVGAYFLGRKAVAAATPESQGDDQVYTWTLPNVFPPGRYVRVTVDGGRLSQDGVELPWNEHGFYEVALDVGSVTLSP